MIFMFCVCEFSEFMFWLLSEGTESAVWDDLTDQTELKFTEDCVSFTTRVSGRYCRTDSIDFYVSSCK